MTKWQLAQWLFVRGARETIITAVNGDKITGTVLGVSRRDDAGGAYHVTLQVRGENTTRTVHVDTED